MANKVNADIVLRSEITVLIGDETYRLRNGRIQKKELMPTWVNDHDPPKEVEEKMTMLQAALGQIFN